MLPGVFAVVHTLGTLLEDTGYKKALRSGDVGGAVGSFMRSVTGVRGNPLEKGQGKRNYEVLNRDSGISPHLVFFDQRN